MTTLVDDEAAIVAVSLDYFEGWFAGDAARMHEALHPELAKRSLETSDSGAERLKTLTKQVMVDATREGVGKTRGEGDRDLEIRVEDVHGAIASVTARSTVYREYLHLARTEEGWKIVNALWAWAA
jgi:Putative lumazine-binding